MQLYKQVSSCRNTKKCVPAYFLLGMLILIKKNIMKEEKLQPGKEVKLTLESGKEFEGRIISRSGIGDVDNYVPSLEVIQIENVEGVLEVSLSQIKDGSER